MKKNSKFFILLGIFLAMLLSALDQTIVATAMPQIVSDLNGMSHLSWVFTAYMLASTVTIPIYGKLSDIYGRRGLFLLGIGIFLLGSILSGLSHTMLQLILFRGLQGIGGGAIMVNAIAIIGEIFPPAERGKWQGVIGAVFGVASIAGPLLGGWITDNASWHWVFYVNVPVGILALSVLASAMPKIVHDVKDRTIDFLGGGLLVLGLVPLLLGLVWGGSEYAWNSWQIITSFAVALVALVGFVLAERKAHDPIISLPLFKNKVFTVSVITTFLTSMGMFGAIIYIPIFAQGVIGVSATNSGVILMPLMISLVISSMVTGQIISRTGKYKWLTIIGLLVIVIGMYLFSQIGVDTTNSMLSLRMIVLGLGLGVTMPVFTIAVQSAFSHEKLGEVTAGTQLFRSIGATVGTAVLGGVMNSQLSEKLANIQNDPFVQTMKKMAPDVQTFEKIDSNTIQGLLNPAAQEQIKAMFVKIPANMQQQVITSFDGFINTIKIAFSQSIDHVYIIATILMAAAFIIVLFLPEIPLRKTNRPALEEAGAELEAELGQADKKDEPEL